MQKLPVLSAKVVVKVLTKFGFQVHCWTGSYVHLWNEGLRLLTKPNPVKPEPTRQRYFRAKKTRKIS